VTSIERTAYPRFKRLMSAREMHVFFTPKPEEAAWVRERRPPTRWSPSPENDPVEQEKAVKLTSLLGNCVIFHTTLDLMEVVRELQAEGWRITGEDLAAISPYLTDHIMRFGTYATTELTVRPDAFDPHLDIEFDAEEEVPAAA
jgi:hypothetical protein